MLDFQVFLMTLHPVVWTLLTIAIGLMGAYAIFALVRVRMDPSVRVLADLAYKAAGTITGLPVRGDPPPVGLKSRRWQFRGAWVIGNYKGTGAFGKVLWDRVLVIDDPAHIWPILVHEMVHAIRRRNGLPSSEAAAYASRAPALGMITPEITALLEELK